MDVASFKTELLNLVDAIEAKPLLKRSFTADAAPTSPTLWSSHILTSLFEYVSEDVSQGSGFHFGEALVIDPDGTVKAEGDGAIKNQVAQLADGKVSAAVMGCVHYYFINKNK